VQVYDDGLDALLVPRAMDLVLAENLKIGKLHVKTPIMTGDWCEKMVQMEAGSTTSRSGGISPGRSRCMSVTR
jgi:hypothetical protein